MYVYVYVSDPSLTVPSVRLTMGSKGMYSSCCTLSREGRSTAFKVRVSNANTTHNTQGGAVRLGRTDQVRSGQGDNGRAQCSDYGSGHGRSGLGFGLGFGLGGMVGQGVVPSLGGSFHLAAMAANLSSEYCDSPAL